MRTKCMVSLNGAWLHELDSAIITQGVSEGAAALTVNTVNLAGASGQRVVSSSRDSIDVTVSFSIREKDMDKRTAIMDKIIAWARHGGKLATNYRTGKHMEVYCVTLPAAGCPKDWTSEYSIVFRSANVPHWSSDVSRSVSVAQCTSASISFAAAGTAKAPVLFSMKNKSSVTINTAKIVVYGQQMAFANLALASGETLVCSEDEYGTKLSIPGSNARSAMSRRTTGSVDAIMVSEGTHTITLESNALAEWTITHEARWE